MLHTDREFRRETVELDGNRFVGCTFVNCTMVYAAYEAVSFDRCVFRECDWAFEGAADNMLSFLTALYAELGTSGQDLVELVFQNVRDGSFMASRRPEAVAS